MGLGRAAGKRCAAAGHSRRSRRRCLADVLGTLPCGARWARALGAVAVINSAAASTTSAADANATTTADANTTGGLAPRPNWTG